MSLWSDLKRWRRQGRRQERRRRSQEEEVSGSTTGTVSLTIQRQEMSEWCWAAVSVSVDRFFRPDSTHTQCEIAGAALKSAMLRRQPASRLRRNAIPLTSYIPSSALAPAGGRSHS